MKKKAPKNKVVDDTSSTIKNYFKCAPNLSEKDPRVCEEEKEPKVSTSKSVYVDALKQRLKSKISVISVNYTIRRTILSSVFIIPVL